MPPVAALEPMSANHGVDTHGTVALNVDPSSLACCTIPELKTVHLSMLECTCVFYRHMCKSQEDL
jgi:hypothetical protein